LDAAASEASLGSAVTAGSNAHPTDMPPALADALLAVIALHAALGALFAIVFHWRGLARIDAAAAHAGLGFRALVTPGAIALWPLLAHRWWTATRAEAAP
jgi:hypothetical protein